jgi:hypothetical protein
MNGTPSTAGESRGPVRGFTVARRSNCGKIFTTINISQKTNLPVNVLVRFGKAGGCGSALADGIATFLSLALRSGLDPRETIKAISGIGCHLGSRTCLNAVAESIGFVLVHLQTGQDLNDMIEEHDFSHANKDEQWEPFE